MNVWIRRPSSQQMGITRIPRARSRKYYGKQKHKITKISLAIDETDYNICERLHKAVWHTFHTGAHMAY